MTRCNSKSSGCAVVTKSDHGSNQQQNVPAYITTRCICFRDYRKVLLGLGFPSGDVIHMQSLFFFFFLFNFLHFPRYISYSAVLNLITATPSSFITSFFFFGKNYCDMPRNDLFTRTREEKCNPQVAPIFGKSNYLKARTSWPECASISYLERMSYLVVDETIHYNTLTQLTMYVFQLSRCEVIIHCQHHKQLSSTVL